MKSILSAKEVLHLYAINPHLKGGYGEVFGHKIIALDKHLDNSKLAAFQYTFLDNQKNIQETVHGGALATLIDIITTIGILRMTPHRTISISLSTQFLNVIKTGEQVEIQTEIAKIGKSIVFADCRIFSDPLGKRKLACKGQHIKQIGNDKWNFMKDTPHHNDHIH